MKALEVARYLLSLVDYERDQTISNMALQKLLYYCQGYYLALTGKPLFDDAIEAWQHGPVVNDVYQNYKKYKDKPIAKVLLTSEEKKLFKKNQRDTIEFVFNNYSVYSAFGLREKTHREAPWLETYKEGRKHLKIDNNRMLLFFKTKYNNMMKKVFCVKTKEALKSIKDTNISILEEYEFG